VTIVPGSIPLKNLAEYGDDIGATLEKNFLEWWNIERKYDKRERHYEARMHLVLVILLAARYLVQRRP
jgi:hypothetical protein